MMEEDNSHGPQYPAQGGAKISGEPASGVKAAGSSGGHATANPLNVVSDQATSVCNVTGKTSEKDGTPRANQLSETEKDGASRTNRSSETAQAVNTESLSEDMDTMSLKKKRPSGAWRKKQRALRRQNKAHGGSPLTGTESAEAVPDTSKAGTSSETSNAEARIGEAMRNGASSLGADATPVRRGSIAGKRDHSGTLSPKKDQKRHKKGTPMQASYQEAAETALQVHIVNSDDVEAPMSEEVAKHIRQALVDLLDAEPTTGAAPIPRFNRSGLVQGSFQVACADQASLDWLCATAGKIPPKDGVGFKAVKYSDLPKLSKVSVWIPGPAVPADKVLERLQKQNPTLRTRQWKIQYRDIKASGQLLVLGVDSFSLDVLRQLKGRAYFELSRVTFRLPGEAEK